jgi:uncharacterized membrane protein
VGTLYRLSVVVHILATSAWVGGTLFLAFVSIPIARTMDDPLLRRALLISTAKRFRALAWASLVLLGITGVLNAVGRWGWPTLTSTGFWKSEPGMLLTLKLLLVGITVILAAYHDFYLGPRVARTWQPDSGGAATAVPAQKQEPSPGAGPEESAGAASETSPEQARQRRRTLALARVQMLLLVAVITVAVLIVRGLP